jgi:hypothetical protein
MASKFLQKNKRKSVLALLLLLLRWKKGALPALLMVLLLMLVFILPPNILGIMVGALDRAPFGKGAAAAISRWAKLDTKGGFEDLMVALRHARQGGGWNAFSGGRGGHAAPSDSLGMVRGSKTDLIGSTRIADRIQGGSSINGVLTPEQAQDGGSAVELRQDDMQGERAGWVQTAYAGGFGGMGGTSGMGATGGMTAGYGPGAGKSEGAGMGPYAEKGLFAGKGPKVNANELLRSALNSAKVPVIATKRVAAQGGRLSRDAAQGNKTKQRGMVNVTRGLMQTRALAQLADVRARDEVSRDPLCTAFNGCPPEYASVNTGAVYDGDKLGPTAPGVLMSEMPVFAVDGITGAPQIPNETDLRQMQDEVNRIEREAKQCEEADVRYKPEEGQYTREIESASQEMNEIGCGGGGCSSSKAKKCKRIGDRMKSACRSLDTVMRNHYNDCPLMKDDGPYQAQDCAGGEVSTANRQEDGSYGHEVEETIKIEGEEEGATQRRTRSQATPNESEDFEAGDDGESQSQMCQRLASLRFLPGYEAMCGPASGPAGQ